MEGKDAEVFAELRHNVPLPRQLAAELHIRPAPTEDTALPADAARSPAQLALIFSHLAGLGYGVTWRNNNMGAARLLCRSVDAPGCGWRTDACVQALVAWQSCCSPSAHSASSSPRLSFGTRVCCWHCVVAALH